MWLRVIPRLGVWLAGALTVAGCTATPDLGEVTNDQCQDGSDNDLNGLTDCDDPKCRGSHVCSFPAPDGSTVPLPPKDAGKDAAAPPHEAEAGIADASTVPDAEIRDASMPIDAAACADACMPDWEGSLSVRLRITAAQVPAADQRFIPFDIPGFYSDWERSGLGPDPFVVVRVNDNQVFESSVARDTLMPLWIEAGVRLNLLPEDVIEFEAYDSDGDKGDPRSMLSCVPVLTRAPGFLGAPLSCRTDRGYIDGVVEPAP